MKHQDKPATCKSLASETEQETQANSLAMRESLDSSTAAETWALLVDTRAATSVAPQGFASHLELSPAPSTFQLSTATGQAMKTYGLRQVHLQCHGLSLTVSFVIADVVTPLLGFDTILQHSLSLHVEHDLDLQRSLVNPAGDKTQLERMGKHLYLLACPLQHGLSTCIPGSLSEAIGLLPEDKEIHDQHVASRSSSSIDLDEDRRSKEEEEEEEEEEAERDSLNFQCHSVSPKAPHAHGNSSFVCVFCEDAADSGGELSQSSL